MKKFKLCAPYKASGDQPEAIKKIIKNMPGRVTLLGVTGSGKTFTMANVVASQNNPVVILSPNKTLAAQLYEEFSLFFPENKVCYFVSYYDYYQPESYLPAQDVYIPKETKVNDEIERLRVEATASLLDRSDTIIIASVSSIYSLGNPSEYKDLVFKINVDEKISRDDLIRKLIFVQYNRNDFERKSGTFQVLGNCIEIILPYIKEKLRVELWGNKIESLQLVSKNNNNVIKNIKEIKIFPAKHFVSTEDRKRSAIKSIGEELNFYVPKVENPIFRERIKTRVTHDLEMLKEVGHCQGIENYSIHFDGRKAGEAPYCLFDFLPKDFILMIDESHIAIPQLRGMYLGDRSRKKALVEFGFRLPSAYDNRPLKFEEIEKKFFSNVIFVSATPSEYEIKNSKKVVEQIIRPTGLLDPKIEIYPRLNQIKTLLKNIKETKGKGFRTLITVLTKKMAEELAKFLEENKIKVCYLHSDIKTDKRTELLQKLRMGIFDCMVGVNLLREGLDLPEVALVAIMDADIESFLRDKRSLIQIIGRAARNTESKVILFADKVTKSMQGAISETDRRRTLQEEFNKKHNIKPRTVKREVTKSIAKLGSIVASFNKSKVKSNIKTKPVEDLIILEKQMHEAAENLDFEKAIELREKWLELKKLFY